MARRSSSRARTPSLAALRRGLLDLLANVDGQMERATDPSPPSPELLHDLHRDLRRLAGGLLLWGDLLRAPDAAEIRPIVRRLRRFARLVGRVRDRDVTLELLTPSGRRRSTAEARALHGFLGRLGEDARTGRELLRAFLTTERRGGLFEQVRRVLRRASRPGAARQLTAIVHDAWQDHRRRVHKAHRKARHRPDVDRLHRLRIHIRRWRHLASLAEIADVPVPAPFESGLPRLQARLGRLHDLDVALSSLPPELRGSAAARRLADALGRERRAIAAALAGPGHPPATRRRIRRAAS